MTRSSTPLTPSLDEEAVAGAAALSEGARLRLLYRISRDLNQPEPGAGLDLNVLLPHVLTITARHSGATAGCVIVLDEHGRLANAWVLDEGELVAPNVRSIALLMEQGLAGWVTRTRQGVLLANTLEDPRWLRVPDKLPKSSTRAYSAIVVPLLLPDRVVGVVTYLHPVPGHFTDEDYALLSAVADQVTVAIENARLFAAERRGRQVDDTLYEIAAMVSSSLDLAHVLALILEQLARIVPYDNGAVLLLRGDRLETAALHPATHGPFAPLPVALIALREQRVLVLADAAADTHWQAAQGDQGVRSWIGAPLIAQGLPIGLIALTSATPDRYDDDDGRVASAFASHAAIAVSNARLYEEARKQVEYLSFLQATSRDLTSSLDLGLVLQQLLQRVISLLGVEAGSIGLIDADEETLVFEVAAGAGAEAVQGLRLPLGAGLAGWVAQTGEALLVPDVRNDPRWYRMLDDESGFRTRSVIAAPIEVKGRRLGVIEAINPLSGEFTQQHLSFVRALAGLAGSAIANAQAYAALRAAEERYAGLFADSIDPILISDIAGTITEANRKACDFLGFEHDDLIGMNINLVHRMGSGVLGEQRLAHVQSGAELIFKTRAWTKSGREVPVEVHASRIRRGEQEVIQWIEHDITERMELEEMREDLLSMIIHDLRAPLGNVLSSLEMLEASVPRDENSAMLAPLVDIALRSSQRLSHLVNSLLDLRRLESGQAMLDREPSELPKIIMEALDQVQSTADSREVRLRRTIADDVPMLLIDADMIRRVLINLLDNAVKYTPPGRLVQVTVSAPPREPVVVAVQDEGPGISPEHQRMIFEKFGRVRRAGGPKGLGLGLAFCRLAVEAHGGRIWVESTPGQGAIFKFTLPVSRS